MNIEEERKVKAFFLLGAVFNWAITVAWFFAYPWVFPLLGIEIPDNPMFMQLFSVLAFVFGIGYYLVSINPIANRDIALMGIVGKIMVFLVITYYWLIEAAPLSLFFIGSADLVFALIMVVFWLRYKNIYL